MFSSSTRLAFAWAAASVATATLPLTLGARVAVVASAAAVMLIGPRPDIARRSIAVVALIPAALSDPPAWAFVLAGALLALASTPSRTSRAGRSPLERIQQRLEWHRRRNERADIVWIHCPEMSQEQTEATLDTLRITDAAAQAPEGGSGDLVAMLDPLNLDRGGFERRIREVTDGPTGIGWATFPEDGVTLDTLFQHARSAAVAQVGVPGVDTRTQALGLGRRLGQQAPQGVPVQSSSQG